MAASPRRCRRSDQCIGAATVNAGELASGRTNIRGKLSAMMDAVNAHDDQVLECWMDIPQEGQGREQLLPRHSTDWCHCFGHRDFIPTADFGETRWLDVGPCFFEVEGKISNAVKKPNVSKRDVPCQIPGRAGLGSGLKSRPASGIAAITLEVVRTSRASRSSVKSRVAVVNSAV